jgi:cephalosporin hydroxylase
MSSRLNLVTRGGDATHEHKWEQAGQNDFQDGVVLAVCRCGAESAIQGKPKPLSVTDAFHVQEYNAANEGRSWGGAKYFGCKIWKLPQDLHTYQEVITEIKPALIIETGTAFGGSALYFAHLLDQLSHGHVVTIDIKPLQPSYPRHSRIDYITDYSSVDAGVVREVKAWCQHNGEPVMVILDSLHTKDHVLAELDIYAPLVSGGSYLVVEDTNINGHPVFPEHGPGPQEALDEWLPKHPDFRIDEARATKFGYGYHSWLRRIRV